VADRWPPRPDAGGASPSSFDVPCGGRLLRLGGGRTRVLAIVNATPDSFYGGSRSSSRDEAIAAGLRAAADGAAVLDVGGESTRPGAAPVPADEECDRILPVIAALARQVDVPIAVDTYKAEVARAAIAAGAALINDVSGGLLDPEMAQAVADLGVPYIVGHLRGTPATMQDSPSYADAPAEVRSELALRIQALVAAGVSRERLLLDPGIGFGKRFTDNLELLARLEEMRDLGRPIVVGVSRKGFLGEIARRCGLADAGPEDRLESSLAVAVLAAERGAVLVRTHDVLATRRALAAADAILHGV
jgi:dihydropteroate synthase